MERSPGYTTGECKIEKCIEKVLKNARSTSSRIISYKNENESVITVIKRPPSSHLLATGTANVWANVASIWHPWDFIILDHKVLPSQILYILMMLLNSHPFLSPMELQVKYKMALRCCNHKLAGPNPIY